MRSRLKNFMSSSKLNHAFEVMVILILSLIFGSCNAAAPEAPGNNPLGTCTGSGLKLVSSSNVARLAQDGGEPGAVANIDFPRKSRTIYMGGFVKTILEKNSNVFFTDDSSTSSSVAHHTHAGFFELESPALEEGKTVPDYVNVSFWGNAYNPAPKHVRSLSIELYDPKNKAFYQSFPVSSNFYDKMHDSLKSVVKSMVFPEPQESNRLLFINEILVGSHLFDTSTMSNMVTDSMSSLESKSQWCGDYSPDKKCSPFYDTKVYQYRINVASLNQAEKNRLAALFYLFNPSSLDEKRNFSKNITLTQGAQNVMKSWGTLLKTLHLFEELRRAEYYFYVLNLNNPTRTYYIAMQDQRNKEIFGPAIAKTWDFYDPSAPGKITDVVTLLNKINAFVKGVNSNHPLSAEIEKYITDYLSSPLTSAPALNFSNLGDDDPNGYLSSFIMELEDIIRNDSQIKFADFIKKASIALRDKAKLANKDMLYLINSGQFSQSAPENQSLGSLFLGWHDEGTNVGFSNNFFTAPSVGEGIYSNTACSTCQQNAVRLSDPRSIFTVGTLDIPQVQFSSTIDPTNGSGKLLQHKFGCEMTTTLIMLGGMPLQTVPAIADLCNETDGPVASDLPIAQDPVEETMDMMNQMKNDPSVGGPCDN